MEQDIGCDTCKFQHQHSDLDDTGTRCGNCRQMTLKGREYYPSWEERNGEERDPIIIHHV